MITVLENFESLIEEIIKLFNQKFGEGNPLKKWRNGLVERVGFLGVDNSIEYSFHGAGCTIEFNDGRIVSFDFDENGMYVYSIFKFKLYLDSSLNDFKFLSLEELTELVNELVRLNKIQVIEGIGMRLAAPSAL